MNGIVLRKRATGLYLLEDLGWTRDAESAKYFADETEACKFAREHRIGDYELGTGRLKWQVDY